MMDAIRHDRPTGAGRALPSLLLAAAAWACGSPAATADGDADAGEQVDLADAWEVGPFFVKVEPGGAGGAVIAVVHGDDRARVLWESPPGGGFAAAGIGTATVTEARGSFDIRDQVECVADDLTVAGVAASADGALEVTGRLEAPLCATGFTLRFRGESAGQLGFELSLADGGAGSTARSCATPPTRASGSSASGSSTPTST